MTLHLACHKSINACDMLKTFFPLGYNTGPKSEMEIFTDSLFHVHIYD